MTRERRLVHPLLHRIVKFFPNDPPERGDTVLVDGERCQVVKARVSWEGLTWRLRGPITVKPAPSGAKR